jgi:hypothetical protein
MNLHYDMRDQFVLPKGDLRTVIRFPIAFSKGTILPLILGADPAAAYPEHVRLERGTGVHMTVLTHVSAGASRSKLHGNDGDGDFTLLIIPTGYLAIGDTVPAIALEIESALAVATARCNANPVDDIGYVGTERAAYVYTQPMFTLQCPNLL